MRVRFQLDSSAVDNEQVHRAAVNGAESRQRRHIWNASVISVPLVLQVVHYQNDSYLRTLLLGDSLISCRTRPEISRDTQDRHQPAPQFNLETAVGCARVCRERRAGQGETKQRTLVRNEEQRRQDRRARCNRVHSAVT